MPHSPADRGRPSADEQGAGETKRNPLLLFLLSGVFLLRLAHRNLSGLLLFQEPPS